MGSSWIRIKPVSLAFPGRFFTTKPPREAPKYCLLLVWRFTVQSLSHVWLLANPWTIEPVSLFRLWDFLGRILEWVAISFSREPSWPRNWTPGLRHCRQIPYLWVTREPRCRGYPIQICKAGLPTGNTRSWFWSLQVQFLLLHINLSICF